MPRLLCVEFYQGAPLSYMTEAAARTLEALSTAATLVPTTTRTPEQYRRVQLLDKPPRFAICANGGHLLVDGREDPEWAAAVRSQVADACAPLADVQHHLTQSGGDFVLKRRTASDLFAYTVVDRASLPPGWVEDLTGWCAERGWRTSLQGRKVYCLPACLTKAAAAAEVARRAAAPGMLAAATRCSTSTCSKPPTARSVPPTASCTTPAGRPRPPPSPPPAASARARRSPAGCWNGRPRRK